MKKHFISTILTLSLVFGFIYYISLNECEENNKLAPGDYPKGVNKMLTYFSARFGPDYTDADYINAVKQADQLKSQSNKVLNTNLEWEELGPNNVGGRTRSVLIDKDDPNLIYAAAVSGGIYISKNRGDLWEPYAYNTELPTTWIGQMRQSIDGTIYFSTGEPDHGYQTNVRGAFAPSYGIFKFIGPDGPPSVIASTDQLNGGDSEFSRINKIELHPTNANIIYVATNNGLRVSENGGLSWDTPNMTPSSSSTAHDIRIAPSNPLYMYATVGSNTYRSTNGGTSFTSLGLAPSALDPVNSTINTGGGGRKELAISPTNHLYAYISVVNGSGRLQRVVQTKDGGETWFLIGEYDELFLAPFGDNTQGWYDHAIAVDPSNPERIFYGGVTVFSYSNTSGWIEVNTNFGGGQLNPFYIHSDIHSFTFDLNDPGTLFIGTDGGVFRTYNAFDDQPFFIPRNKNYNATQYYSVAADFLGRVVGGTQDNSCPYVDYQGLTLQEGKVLNGGDGAYTEISDIDANIMFLSSQNASNVRSSNRGESTASFISTDDETTYLGNALFIAPFHLYEDLTRWNELESISELTNLVSFSIVGTDTTRTIDHTVNLNAVGGIDPFVQLDINNGLYDAPFGEMVTFPMTNAMRLDSIKAEKKARFYSGSNRMFVLDNPLELSNIGTTRPLGVFPQGVCSAIGHTKDGDVMWAGSTSGALMRVRGLNDLSNYTEDNDVLEYDGDKATWSANITAIPWTTGSFVTSVNPNPINPSQVVVTVASGSQQRIYVTNNGLSSSPTWESIHSNFPTGIPVYEAIYDELKPWLIYAATELGVWSYDTQTQLWTEENIGIGRCRVVRIRQEPMRDISCPVIYIGTFGRGIWRSVKSTVENGFQCDVTLPRYNVGIEETIISEANDINISLAPNPMTTSSKLSFDLNNNAYVSVNIYSLNGQSVQSYNLGSLNNGSHTIDLQRENLTTGNYLVVVSANGRNHSSKLVVR